MNQHNTQIFRLTFHIKKKKTAQYSSEGGTQPPPPDTHLSFKRSFRVLKIVSSCLTRTCNKQMIRQKNIRVLKSQNSSTAQSVNTISLVGTDLCWVPKLTTLFSECTIRSLICFKVASLRSRSSSRDTLRRRLASRDSSEWACGRSGGRRLQRYISDLHGGARGNEEVLDCHPLCTHYLGCLRLIY